MEGQLSLFPILNRTLGHHLDLPGDKDWRGCLFTDDYKYIEYFYADSREELMKIMDKKEEDYFKEKE
mgnify:CR=1 FL=1